jgi:serine/threonine protein kinase
MPKLKIFSSKKRDSKATTIAADSTGGCSSSNPIYKQLERLQQQSPLWCTRPLKTVAILERDEVHTSSSDKGLAIGTFYHTFVVTRICLKERHGGSTADDSTIDGMLEDSDKDHDRDRDKDKQQHAARQQLAASTIDQDGGNYYCIKHIPKKIYKKLHQDRGNGRFLRAVSNLLVEANYLSRCDHPHILHLQGQADTSWAVEDPKQKQFDALFLITDRISETLEDRLERWRAEQGKYPTRHPVDPKCPLFQKKLGYVRDIASALHHLHQRQIMVLGLNPTGIGFSAQSGHIQLCDLGTCRETAALDLLHESNNQLDDSQVSAEGEKAIRFEDDEIGDGERFSSSGDITGSKSRDASFIVPFVETGTIPRYMAPELVTQGAAGASLLADSYSLSMITVETLTLQKAYSSFKAGQFLVKVCMEGKRPNLSMYPLLPSPVEGILRRSWRHSAEKRWTCGEIFEGYKLIIEKLQGDDGSKPPSNDEIKMSSRTLVLPDIPRLRTSTKSFDDTSTMEQSVQSRDISSKNVAPSTSLLIHKRTSKQHQRREKRGTYSMSKSMSMRNFSTRKSLGSRMHNSASDIFAAAGAPQGRRSNVDDVLVIEPEEASSQAITFGSALSATPPRKSKSPRRNRTQQGEVQVEVDTDIGPKEHSAADPPQPDGRSQEAQHKQDPTVDEAVPKGDCPKSASSYTLPNASDETNEQAIVLGDGTTIAIKKQPSKRNSFTMKKEPSRRDLKPQRPKMMKRSQSGPSLQASSSAAHNPFGDVRPRSRRVMSVDDVLPKVEEPSSPEEVKKKKPSHRKSSGANKAGGSIPEHKGMTRSHSGLSLRASSSSAGKAVGDVRQRSRRILSMDDVVPKLEVAGAPPKQGSSEEIRTKKVAQRKSSGTRKEGGSIVELDNPSRDAPSSTKKLPRRKHSTDSLSRQMPSTKQRDAPSTERMETYHNKAKHERSVERHQEPVLATPQLQRRVSASDV